MPATLYPLFLKLEHRLVLVVGAGKVAERKILDLLACGAQVRVVAPKATRTVAQVASTGSIDWRARSFAPSDLAGAWLVVLATDDPRLQRAVARNCSSKRIFVLAVDDPALCSAYSASVVRRGTYAIAISSAGETPALTRLLRELLERALPGEQWVDRARALRRRWRQAGTPMQSRFAELVRMFAGETSAIKPRPSTGAVSPRRSRDGRTRPERLGSRRRAPPRHRR